jgi:hypothetical protein
MRRTGEQGNTSNGGERTTPRGPVIGRVTLALAIVALSVVLAPAMTAAATEPASTPRPVNTEAPKVTGTPASGQTLSCSQGAWANNPTGYSYAWLRNGSPIVGQVASTYVVQNADQGQSLSCQVTASNTGGEYTISGLRSGSYQVDFFSEEEGSAYAPQYYSDKASPAEAGNVAVTVSNKASGIDAALGIGGQISGTVTAAGGGALAKVEVCAAQEASGLLGGGCGVSNEDGAYTISGLASGSYSVEFYTYQAGNYLPDIRSGVSVSAPSVTAGVDGALSTGGQIAGKVTALSGGAPLAGIEVCASGEAQSGYDCQDTSASGEYTLSQLATGTYEVQFSRESSAGNYLGETHKHVSVTAPGETALDAQLASAGQIEGTVSAPGGAPLADTQVCAEGSTNSCAFTNASGVYVLPGLSAGSYEILFYGSEASNYAPQYYDNKPTSSGDEPVAVTVSHTTSNIDAELHHGATISGKVTAAAGGAGLGEIEVCAEGTNVTWFACVETNAGGEYTMPGLPGGTYKVEFRPGSYFSFELDEIPNALAQTIEGVSVAAGAAQAGVDAALASGGQIAGTVTSAASGAALSKIIVCAEGPAGGGCAFTNSGGGSTSAASNALAVPAPNSAFSLTKAAIFDAKTGDLDIFLKLADPGTLSWSLLFKNSDVGFADAFESTLSPGDEAGAAVAEAAKRKRCKSGMTVHRGKCVHITVPFAGGSKILPAGTIEVKMHAGAKALRALKAGHTLHIVGVLKFQSALGGAPNSHSFTATIHWPKKKRRRHKG